MSGQKPDVFCEEMYLRTFETLEDVIREAREELSSYQDYLEISDRIKKVEPNKEFSKPRKDFPTAVSNLKKGAKVLFQRFKKLGSPIPRVDDLKDVECFKGHKKGQYANKYPESKAIDGKSSLKIDHSGPNQESEIKSVRQIRIRYLDIEDNCADLFIGLVPNRVFTTSTVYEYLGCIFLVTTHSHNCQ